MDTRLHRNCAGIVVDYVETVSVYANTTMITRTPTVNFEGFLLSLKVQSVKTKYLHVYPIAIIFNNLKIGGYL